MKHTFRKIAALAFCALLLGACSGWRDNRKAAAYADRLEQAESVSAEEYAEMVDFYCAALDRTFAELEPVAKEHADAVNRGDSIHAAKTEKKLSEKTAEMSADRKDLTRLGSQLLRHVGQLPDSTRTRLFDYITSVSDRYSDY